MMNDLYADAIIMLADPATSSTAVNLLRQIAEDGDTRAMCDYGRLFDTMGAPVTQNGEEAFKWYLRAAEYGDDRGQFYVGESFYHGRIVPQDYIQACKWFTLSAEKGYAIAQYYLGHMYYRGNGVPIDEKEAMRWFKLSIDRACNEARVTLGDIYCSHKNYESYDRAFRLYNDAMRDGYPPAYYKVGMMVYSGQGRPINYSSALKYFRSGADKEDLDCIFMVGKMSYNGEGTIKDMTVGVRYLNIAESMGSEDAKEFLNKIDHTRKNNSKWGSSGSNLIEVDLLDTPDLLQRPAKEDVVNRSVSEGPREKKGFFSGLFGKK
jgi:TPR repeat protein